ncbi:MAG: ATP-binding cassette domain-containing protein [Mycobacteriales bacterium]
MGESGSGKSTTGRAILNLQPATSGQVLYGGKDVTQLKAEGRGSGSASPARSRSSPRS